MRLVRVQLRRQRVLPLRALRCSAAVHRLPALWLERPASGTLLGMKCPRCRQEIEMVRVYSTCWQIGTLVGRTIVNYDSIEEILETIAIRCPECGADIQDVVEQT